MHLKLSDRKLFLPEYSTTDAYVQKDKMVGKSQER